MAAIKSMETTLVKTKSGSEGENTTIGGLTSIGGVTIEAGDIETTDLDSTDQFREFVQGNKDAGELALEGIVKSDSQFDVMVDLVSEGTVEEWTVNWSNGAKWVFDGYLKAFGDGEKDIDDTVVTFSATIKITGVPVFTSGSTA